MLLKKIYQFLQSKPGLAITIALYFILAIPLTTSTDALIGAVGEQVGKLISPLIIVFVLSRFYKWNRNQKILHIFFIAFVFGVMMSQKSLMPIVNLVSILALLTLIVQIILEAFKKKPAKGE